MSAPAPDQERGRTWSPVPDTGDPGNLADRFSRGFEPVTAGDWLLIALALVDILLLVARDVYAGFLPPIADTAIVWIDLGILGLFAIEFIAEASRASNKLAYARNHWYEIVGMVPIAHWGFRVFRLVRLLRMYVVSRYPTEIAPERDWSYALVRGLILHYRSVLLEEITDPIVLTSIDVIEGPLVRARFAETIGNSINERRENIQNVVQESVRQTKGIGRIADTAYGQRLIRTATEATLETTIHTLESDELNEVISASIQDILEEVRDKVRDKQYALEGGSRFHPTFTQ